MRLKPSRAYESSTSQKYSLPGGWERERGGRKGGRERERERERERGREREGGREREELSDSHGRRSEDYTVTSDKQKVDLAA